jgi:DNA polymerase I-like protein with 3'-5' exonuclease and polymerase domains
VRSGFVAPPGCVILAADYCQIEFRLMAHFSGDAGMLHAFSSGQDPFRALGATWLKKSSQQVST